MYSLNWFWTQCKNLLLLLLLFNLPALLIHVNKIEILKRFFQIRIVFSIYRKARRKDKDAGTTEDPKLYLEEAALERQLPELDLKVLVDLPQGLDYNEWLASHTLSLFDHINLVYGSISEFCTPTGCSDMTGPGLRFVYLTYVCIRFHLLLQTNRLTFPFELTLVVGFDNCVVSGECNNTNNANNNNNL